MLHRLVARVQTWRFGSKSRAVPRPKRTQDPPSFKGRSRAAEAGAVPCTSGQQSLDRRQVAFGSLVLILTAAFYTRGRDVVLFVLGLGAGMVGVVLGQLIAILRIRAFPVFVITGICVFVVAWLIPVMASAQSVRRRPRPAGSRRRRKAGGDSDSRH